MNDYYGENCKNDIVIGSGSGRRPTMLETLTRRKTELEKHLEEINKAIASLEAAPEASALLEVLRKVGGIL